MKFGRWFSFLSSFVFGSILLVGCAQGHCRHKVEVPEVKAPIAAPPEPAPAQKIDGTSVYVFKYDGSLQCGQGKAVTVEAMASELQGIPILSSVKKSDGLMHIQVCGSPTGMANVYQISNKFLKQAEKKGFKRWTFE